MGLDSVELVLEVEEEFEITINDADAEQLRTPRQLAAYVFARLQNAQVGEGACLSQAAFYRLRKVLVSQFKVARRSVRPDSALADLLPGDLRRQWRVLGKAIGGKGFPSLRCSQQLRALLIYAVPFGVPIALLLAVFSGNASINLWAILFLFIALFLGSAFLNDWAGSEIHPEYRRVDALIPYVKLLPSAVPWTPESVLRRVIQISSEQIGIPIEKIEPDHDFIVDLHLE